MSDEVNMEEFQPCTSDLLMGLTGVVLERQVSAIKAASRGDMTSGIETLDEAQSDSATGGSSPTDGGPREFDNALSEEILRSLGVWPPVEVDRLCTEDRRTRFLVEGLLPVESIAIVGGESTIGKSALICQLAICVAGGVSFLGMSTKKSRVLYFDLENSLSDCRDMREALVKHLGIGNAPSDFLLVTEPRNDIENLLDKIRPELSLLIHFVHSALTSQRSLQPLESGSRRFVGSAIAINAHFLLSTICESLTKRVYLLNDWKMSKLRTGCNRWRGPGRWSTRQTFGLLSMRAT